MRLDRFLWFARIVRSRTLAQELVGAGHLRIDGRPVDRPAVAVRIGSVLAFASVGGRIRAIRVEALPARRGPASEAQACYTELLENVSQQPSRR